MAVKLSYSQIHPMLRPSIVLTLTPRTKPEDGTSTKLGVSFTWLSSDGRRRAVARSDISFTTSKKKCLNLVERVSGTRACQVVGHQDTKRTLVV